MTARALHEDARADCGTGTRVEGGLACMWPASGTKKGAIYLTGDSNAGQFTEAVVASGNALGYDVITLTRLGCPFVDLDETKDAAGLCRRFVLDSVAALVKARPALVIVASDSSSWVESPTDELRDPHTNMRATDPDAKARLWEAGVHAAVEPLSAAGIRTVVVAPIPHPDNVALATCPAFRIMTDVDACAPATSRSLIEKQQRRARDAEQRAVSSLPDVAVFDVTPQLCDESLCPSRRGDVWLYRDPSHLSIAGAMVLEPTFARLISERAH